MAQLHDHSELFPEVMPPEPEKATLEGKNKFFGIWFFLGGETVLFASLFGVYLALKNSTAGGPSSQELFGLGLVFIMTMLLLTSSCCLCSQLSWSRLQGGVPRVEKCTLNL